MPFRRKGGNTEFADLRAAYDELDDDLKIDDRRAWLAEHSILHSRGLLGYTGYTEAERALVPEVRHPVVRRHPGSKAQERFIWARTPRTSSTYPCRMESCCLRELMEHATERRFVHSHIWRPGDLVIWDNRCTLHRGRRYDDIKYKRDLRRVTTQDLTTAKNNPELAGGRCSRPAGLADR